MAIKIVHLYPDELNLYGDSGNIACIVKRLYARGYNAEVVNVGVGENIPSFDLLFIGGGQDREMMAINKDIKRKADALSYYIHKGNTILAICGGYQLLGEYYKMSNGSVMELTGAIPFFTEGSKHRMIGNTVFSTPFGNAVGFENHSGKTYLSKDIAPLGRIIKGFGNNGEDKTEGVLFKNTFGTYAHGPVLPKNPSLADEIIKRMLGVDSLINIDDELENNCHRQLILRYT